MGRHVILFDLVRLEWSASGVPEQLVGAEDRPEVLQHRVAARLGDVGAVHVHVMGDHHVAGSVQVSRPVTEGTVEHDLETFAVVTVPWEVVPVAALDADDAGRLETVRITEREDRRRQAVVASLFDERSQELGGYPIPEVVVVDVHAVTMPGGDCRGRPHRQRVA
jgi:hypothetical protein